MMIGCLHPHFAIPAVFTEDALLDTRQFVDEAKKRELSITLDELQDLHRRSMLLPVFRVSDTASEGRRVKGVPAFAECREGVAFVGWRCRRFSHAAM
jgi:hypothetical protein